MSLPNWTEHTSNESLRVALVVGGFPSTSQPARGVFNYDGALSTLRHGVDLIVFQSRMLKPGRAILEGEHFRGVPVVRFALPQIPVNYNAPFKHILQINLFILRTLGWWALRRWLNECDVIHSGQAFPLGSVCGTWAGQAQVCHVTQLIGSDVEVGLMQHNAVAGVQGWERTLRGVTCNSKSLMKKFQELYPNVPHMTTIYRGTRLDHFAVKGPVAGPLATRPPVRFCFLGGFPPYPGTPLGANTKGGFTLLKAWQTSEKALIEADASLLIAGPQTDSSELRKWHATLNDPNRVIITGVIPTDDVAAYFRAAEVILVPSLQEGLPAITMEAAACGCAVFGSDVGGIPEVIPHNVAGWILPAGDVQAWADALVRGANQLKLLREMGAQGRLHMERHFDSRNYPLETIRFYRTACGLETTDKTKNQDN